MTVCGLFHYKDTVYSRNSDHKYISNQIKSNQIYGNIYPYVYKESVYNPLTHWGRVTHICVGKLTIIGSDNGLSPERRQAIIWTNAGILLIGTLGTNFSEILIGTQTFSLKKIRLKMSSAKYCSFRVGLNVLKLRLGYSRQYHDWCLGSFCRQVISKQDINSLWPSDAIW